jgi:hypothetical protein
MAHGPMPGMMAAQGLEVLKGDGFVDAGEAGPARGVPDDEMRDVGCGEALGDAEIPKAPRLAAEGRAGARLRTPCADRRERAAFIPELSI